MNEILNFYDFIHLTKSLIPHVFGPQSSPLRSCLLAAAPRGSKIVSLDNVSSLIDSCQRF